MKFTFKITKYHLYIISLRRGISKMYEEIRYLESK